LRSRRAADSLKDGFEPFDMPAPGPGGERELPAMREVPPAPPRICEYGPCRNYHTFGIVMDAAKPMGGAFVDGKVVGPADAGETHIEVQHYCYPTVGVETDLGSTPVVSCNRYRPQGLITIGVRRRFARDLATWQAQQASGALERDEAVDAQIAEAAAALADAEAHRTEGAP